MLGKLIVSSVLLFGSELALAGANNAEVTCKSGSGRTVISANIPGDFDEALVQISVDGKVLNYLDKGMVEGLELNGRDPQALYPDYKVTVIETAKDKSKVSIEVYSQGDEATAENLLSIKSVGAIKKLPSSGTRLKFNATVKGQDPREELKQLPEGIVVSCTYVYEI